jgi:hypothetical protein
LICLAATVPTQSRDGDEAHLVCARHHHGPNIRGCSRLCCRRMANVASVPALETKTGRIGQRSGCISVSIEDYPSMLYFPYGYFYERLRRGTPISEVHRIVRGYRTSYACDGDREVYYYFSTGRNRALRFEIWYHERLQVIEVAGEDEDYRWISVDNCSPGLLVEAP